MKTQILQRLKRFDSLPFMFVGSGLSRRYLGLEDWEGLLRHFARLAGEEEFAFEIYMGQAKAEGCKEGFLPKTAELIERDFNEKWYRSERYSASRAINRDLIKKKVSPFKIEIANYIAEKQLSIDRECPELKALYGLGSKSIAGFITTNYDCFLESVFNAYTTFIGQEELLFSQVQGISEIYKIHGCITKPETIVINDEDYAGFNERNAYLASKLLTIFLEHPVVFVGYSISDRNIEKILKAIVKCLSQKHLEQLKERLIFVEWNQGDRKNEISTYSKAFDGEKSLDMTRIILDDYTLLYEALSDNKAKYNVNMLRRLKSDIYELVVTNKPTSRLRVVGLEDDERLDEVELVVGVGVISEFGQKGYAGITADELYRDIVLNDGDFIAERIVIDSLPVLLAHNSNTLPMYKYLIDFAGELPERVLSSIKNEFDALLSNTTRKNRENSADRDLTVIQLEEKYPVEKCLQIIPLLRAENIIIDDLEKFLKRVFAENPQALEPLGNAAFRSDLKRVIRIYDWLKFYNKAKELQI